MKKIFALICLSGLLVMACGSDNSNETEENCLENEPERVSGLNIDGERTEKNVIRNMWPVICRARELYRERLEGNPGLKGMIELSLMVEFNGEIGPLSITRSSMDDKEFEIQVLRLFQFADFDPYGPHNSETEIRYPIHFKP